MEQDTNHSHLTNQQTDYSRRAKRHYGEDVSRRSYTRFAIPVNSLPDGEKTLMYLRNAKRVGDDAYLTIDQLNRLKDLDPGIEDKVDWLDVDFNLLERNSAIEKLLAPADRYLLAVVSPRGQQRFYTINQSIGKLLNRIGDHDENNQILIDAGRADGKALRLTTTQSGAYDNTYAYLISVSNEDWKSMLEMDDFDIDTYAKKSCGDLLYDNGITLTLAGTVEQAPKAPDADISVTVESDNSHYDLTSDKVTYEQNSNQFKLILKDCWLYCKDDGAINADRDLADKQFTTGQTLDVLTHCTVSGVTSFSGIDPEWDGLQIESANLSSDPLPGERVDLSDISLPVLTERQEEKELA